MKILVFLIIFVFALSLFRMILEWSKNNNKCSHLTSVINDQKITVYTGNQNYSHRMVLVSFFAVTNQLQLQYRI